MLNVLAKRLVYFCVLGLLFPACLQSAPASKPTAADRKFARVADDFVSGYLAWRPQRSAALGFHEYDGKMTDYSAASLNAELKRLRAFAEKIYALDPEKLSASNRLDFYLLQCAVESELFQFEEMKGYWNNPIIYARALDVDLYTNFAPLQRLKCIIALEKAAPQLFAAARANLDECLPKPFIEMAIEVSNGTADFLAKDLAAKVVEGISDVARVVEFKKTNDRAVAELRAYAAWLEKEKLPRSHFKYALGRERFQKMLRTQEGIRTSPEAILEMGLRELRQGQQRFADAARCIDPKRRPVDVYRQIQGEHFPDTMQIVSQSRVQKVFAGQTFVEGWPLYAGEMKVELGGTNEVESAKYRLVLSGRTLLSLGRLCVSVKTHCQGLSLEEATRFFEENCFMEREAASREALRGTYDFGCVYEGLGKMALLKLRRDWERQEGAKFSTQRFDGEVLSHGAPPVRLLREVLIQGKAKEEVL